MPVKPQHVQRDAEQEDMYKNVLHNAALPINRLPFEILIAIITFSLGLPTEFKPYPCLKFSWICHHWRSIVLGYPMFWNRIVAWDSGIATRSIIKEVLIRSRTLPLDVSVYEPLPPFFELGPDANRVRTLRTRGWGSYPSLSYFTSHFPSLTKLFLQESINVTDLPIEPLPLLQALQVNIKDLGNLAIPHHLPNLWWLNLQCDISIPRLPLLEALQHLPCLRVLHLLPLQIDRQEEFKVLTNPIVFRHLEALITGIPILQLITAPKLLYFELRLSPAGFFESNGNYNNFCGYNFSRISHIQCQMNDDAVYIMGKSEVIDSDNTPFFRTTGDSKLVFDQIISSYPNEFYIQVSTSFVLSLFVEVVKKANNLNEIIFIDLHWTSDNGQGKVYLLDALRCAKKARSLTVSGEDFVTLCGYLNDRAVCPSLEKLSYSTREKQDVLDSLLDLMTQRTTTTSSWPLEVEIAGFHPVPLEALKPAEELGLRLIQKPGNLPPKYRYIPDPWAGYDFDPWEPYEPFY